MSIFSGTQTGACLHEEHRSTLEALYALEELIGDRKPPALDEATCNALASVALAMEKDVTRHFGFEEDHLFPMLRQAGASFMVDMLTSEHAMIRPLAARIGEAIGTALAEGRFGDAEWAAFRDCAQDLIERETFHIQKEEMGLLAALAQVIQPDMDARLAALHARLEDQA